MSWVSHHAQQFINWQPGRCHQNEKYLAVHPNGGSVFLIDLETGKKRQPEFPLYPGIFIRIRGITIPADIQAIFEVTMWRPASKRLS
jgi:hypothetical protein